MIEFFTFFATVGVIYLNFMAHRLFRHINHIEDRVMNLEIMTMALSMDMAMKELDEIFSKVSDAIPEHEE